MSCRTDLCGTPLSPGVSQSAVHSENESPVNRLPYVPWRNSTLLESIINPMFSLNQLSTYFFTYQYRETYQVLPLPHLRLSLPTPDAWCIELSRFPHQPSTNKSPPTHKEHHNHKHECSLHQRRKLISVRWYRRVRHSRRSCRYRYSTCVPTRIVEKHHARIPRLVAAYGDAEGAVM